MQNPIVENLQYSNLFNNLTILKNNSLIFLLQHRKITTLKLKSKFTKLKKVTI